MSEIPKAGEEWFANSDLATVHVVEAWESRGKTEVDIRGSIGGPVQVSGDDFLCDYSRDVPLTLDVLAGMGWECDGELLRGVTDLRSGRDLRIYFRDGTPSHTVLVRRNMDEINIPSPTTLRDLLNVMRVFGVPVKQSSGEEI